MQVITNTQLGLAISDDGLTVRLEDTFRGCTWVLDGTTRTVVGLAGGSAAEPRPLSPGTVHRLADDTLESVHEVAGGCIRYRWTVQEDHVAVTLLCEGEHLDAGAVSWPGSITSVHGSLRGAGAAVPGDAGAPLRRLLAANVRSWRSCRDVHGHGGRIRRRRWIVDNAG